MKVSYRPSVPYLDNRPVSASKALWILNIIMDCLGMLGEFWTRNCLVLLIFSHQPNSKSLCKKRLRITFRNNSQRYLIWGTSSFLGSANWSRMNNWLRRSTHTSSKSMENSTRMWKYIAAWRLSPKESLWNGGFSGITRYSESPRALNLPWSGPLEIS